MILQGKVFRFGDNVNTDEIIPGRCLNTSAAEELAKNVMEDVRPGFGRRHDIRGAIIVAGENFGCGSSREHAPLAIKTAGIQAVVARSFARIFLRNAINIGLPIVEVAQTNDFHEGDEIEVDLDDGKIRNHSGSKEFTFRPYPEFLQEIFHCGGWLAYATVHPGMTNE